MEIRFTRRELDIMDVLWTHGPSTVAVVREALEDELVLCSQSIFRFADLGDDGLCRGGPDKGCGVIVSAIDVVVDRLD